jgi:hypothetical protein
MTIIKNTTFRFPKYITGMVVSKVDGIPLGVVSRRLFGEQINMFVKGAANEVEILRLPSTLNAMSIIQKYGPYDPRQCEFSLSDASGYTIKTAWDPNYVPQSFMAPINVVCVAGQPLLKNMRITYVLRGNIVTDIHFYALRIDYKCKPDNQIIVNLIILFVIILFAVMITKRKKKKGLDKKTMAQIREETRKMVESW